MIPRTFTAYQSIAAGAKTSRELQAALRCTHDEARRAAQQLCHTGQARRRARAGTRGYVYEVAR